MAQEAAKVYAENVNDFLEIGMVLRIFMQFFADDGGTTAIVAVGPGNLNLLVYDEAGNDFRICNSPREIRATVREFHDMLILGWLDDKCV